MNYERNREISNRNEVHKTQIELASRNNTLIIDTLNLLQLYEKLLKGNISKQKAIDYINSKIGLFNVLKIKKINQKNIVKLYNKIKKLKGNKKIWGMIIANMMTL